MARAVFPGFSEEALTFFRGLHRNNKREWFQPRKAVFEEKVKAPMLELVAALNADMSKFAPLHVTEPAASLYRIYRDTRFSKDKKPYKTHQAAYFPRRGLDRSRGSGYYFAVSHESLAVGGGMYMPLPDVLLAVRTRLADRHAEFRKIVQSKTLRKLMEICTASSCRACRRGSPRTIPLPICCATNSSSSMWNCLRNSPLPTKWRARSGSALKLWLRWSIS